MSRAVLTKHRKALYAIRAFWKQLLHQQVSFRGITAAFDKIEERKRLADRAYQTLLERYPANTKVGGRSSTSDLGLPMQALQTGSLKSWISKSSSCDGHWLGTASTVLECAAQCRGCHRCGLPHCTSQSAQRTSQLPAAQRPADTEWQQQHWAGYVSQL